MVNTLLPKCHIELVKREVEMGYTPLHLAAYQGHRHIIIQLLAHEADPEIPTDDGWLPIHLSAISGHLSCVKELLTHVDNVDDVLTKD